MPSSSISETGRCIPWRMLVFGYLVLHALVATLLPDRLAPLSTLCIVLAELAAIATCAQTALGSGKPVRTLWWLLVPAILLHATAMGLDFRAEALGVTETNFVPGLQVLLGVLVGVPLLLAVSMRFDRYALRPVPIINAVLSLATGALLYVEVFSRLSIHGSNDPADAQAISLLFLTLGVFLAIAATIRTLGADRPEERRFYYVVSWFLWVDALLPAIHNWILVRRDYVWLDLFISFPYLFLVLMITTTPPQFVLNPQPNPRLRRIVFSASPIFLCLGLLVLGVVVSRTHFAIGLAAALMAILGYGALNTLMQSESMEAEEALATAARNLQELVGIDGLTRVPNRRSFDDTLERECSTASRVAQPLSLLMIDVDHFKLLNDTKGHPLGDAYLIQIAQALRSTLPRVSDFVARYGGEEFAVILPVTNSLGAAEVARKLHRAIADLSLAHPASPAGIVTVSIGCSTFDGITQPSPSSLLLAADRALYQAKERGRNRTEYLSIELVESIESIDELTRQAADKTKSF
jgi:diguanylate cyclase (GGDEF)-like protein